MAEQVIIDIELKGLGDAKKGLDDLTKKQIEQRDEIKQTTAEIKEYEKELAALRKEQEAGGQLTDEQIAREQELAANIQTSKVELASQKDELSKVNAERRAAVKEVDQYNTALNAELGSNEQLKAQLAILTKEYNSLSAEQRENTDEGQQLTTQIKDITDKLKENESAVGDNRRNVGNYEEAITSALDKVNIMGVNVGQLTKQVQAGISRGKGYAQSIVAVATATQGASASTGLLSGAMRILKIAVASTGIGLLVLAIGAMVTAVSKFQPLMDRLQIVMAQIGQVVNILVDRFALLGKGLISIFSGNPAKGFNDIKNATSGLNDELEREIELAGRLKAQLIELERSQVILNASLTTAKARIKELENVYNDSTKSVQEKNAAIQEAIKLQQDITKAQEDEQKRLIANTFGYEEYNDKVSRLVDNVLDLDNIYLSAEERARVFDITMKNLGLDISDASETTETINDSILKLAQISLDGETALKRLGSQAKSLNAQLSKNIDESGKKIDELNEFIQKLSEEARISKLTEYEKEIEDIKAKYDEQIALAKEAFGVESEQYKTLMKLRGEEYAQAEADNQQRIYEEVEKRLEKEQLAQDEALQRQLDDLDFLKFRELEQAGLTSEQKLAIDKKYEKEKAELQLSELTNRANLIKAQLDGITADADGGLISPLTPEEETTLKKQLNEINAEMQKLQTTVQGNADEGIKGIDLIEGLGLDEEGREKLQSALSEVSNIITNIGNLMTTITERNKQKIQEQVEAGILSQEQADKKLEQIEKRAFKRQKAMQISMAIVNTAQAVLKTLAETTDFTPVQALRTANAIAIGALGAAQVATIAAQKFQDGGLIQGASHSQGGVPFSVAGRGGFEAEGGEYIVKKSTVDSYGVDFMNALNNMRIPKMFAEGGYVAPTPVGTISDQVSRGVSELVSVTENRQLQVINVEQDFTKLQTKVSNVEQARTY